MLPDLSKLTEPTEPKDTVPPPPPAKDGNDRYFYIGHYASRGSSAIEKDMFNSYIKHGGGPVTYEWRDEYGFQTEEDKEKRIHQPGIDGNVVQFMKRFIKQQQGLRLDKGMNGLVTWWWLNTRMGVDVLKDAGEYQFIYRVPEKWLQDFATKCLEYVFLTSEKAIEQSMVDYKYHYVPWAFLTAIPVPLEYRLLTSDPLDNEVDRRMSNLEVADIVYKKHIESDKESRSAKHYNTLIQADAKQREEENERRAILERQRPELFNPF